MEEPVTRSPVVVGLVTTLAALQLAACSSANGSLFEEVAVPPSSAAADVGGPVMGREPSAANSMQENEPSSSETMQDGELPFSGEEPGRTPPALEPPTQLEPMAMTPPSPRIIAVAPENGASGVSNDVEIVITFSEPMNRELTEAAYQSEAIPSSQVDFSWNEDGTELTIAPQAPLAYSEGSDPELVSARRVSFFMSSSAEDIEGERLAAPEEFSFSLLRQITTTLPAVQNRDLTGTWRSNDTYGQGQCARAQTTMCVGDVGQGGDQYKGFISFDLSGLPAGMTQLAEARLSFEITARPGNPFNGLGELFLDHTAFDAIGPEAFDAEPLAELGSIAESGSQGTTLSADVRRAIEGDLETRNLSQFRLQFEQVTDDDGNADTLISAWDTQSVAVTYLLP